MFASPVLTEPLRKVVLRIKQPIRGIAAPGRIFLYSTKAPLSRDFGAFVCLVRALRR